MLVFFFIFWFAKFMYRNESQDRPEKNSVKKMSIFIARNKNTIHPLTPPPEMNYRSGVPTDRNDVLLEAHRYRFHQRISRFPWLQGSLFQSGL